MRAWVALLMLASGVVHADPMRCGKWVVDETATADQLLAKCGAPASREKKEEDVYINNPAGARVKTENKTVTERWVYQKSTRSLPMVVVIRDGRVMSVQRGE